MIVGIASLSCILETYLSVTDYCRLMRIDENILHPLQFAVCIKGDLFIFTIEIAPLPRHIAVQCYSDIGTLKLWCGGDQ